MKKILIILLLFLHAGLFAQVEQMILPTDLKQQTIITEPSTLRKGFFRASATAYNSLVDKMFNEDGKRIHYQGSNGWAKSWTYNLSVSYGINDRLQVGINIPYASEKIYYSTLNIVPLIDSSYLEYLKVKGQGLGDIDMGVDFQLLYKNEGKTSLKMQFISTFPTGRKNPGNIQGSGEFEKAPGSGYYSLDTRLVFRKIMYPYSLSAYASYKYNFRGSKIFYPGEMEASFKSGDMFYVGGSFNVHLNEWIALMNEIAFNTWSDDQYFDYNHTGVNLTGRYALIYQPSLVFQVRRFRFFEIITFPLAGKNTGADPGYIFALQYTF